MDFCDLFEQKLQTGGKHERNPFIFFDEAMQEWDGRMPALRSNVITGMV
jgi:hypothetical protein